MTFAHYRATLSAREAAVAAIDADLVRVVLSRAPFSEHGRPPGLYRGITELGGLTLAAEVVDWRRFPSARAFMGYTGLIPAEYSSGKSPPRAHHHAPNLRTELAESAWAYRPAPASARNYAAARQAPRAPETVARSWTAQRRLHGRSVAWCTQAGKPNRNRRRHRPQTRRVRRGRNDRRLTPALITTRAGGVPGRSPWQERSRE